MLRFIILIILLFNFNSLSLSAENISQDKQNNFENASATNIKKVHESMPSTINKTISNVGGQLNSYRTENQEKKIDERPNESWWHKFTSDPIATFTGMLFIATCLMYWATRQLVLGAERTAAQELRAYVFTKHDEPIELDVYDKLSVTTTIKNFGKTPAHDMMTFHRIGVYPFPLDATNKLEEPSYAPDSSNSPLAPGEVVYLRITIPTRLTQADIDHIESGKVALFVFGEIKYKDIFEKTRCTKYCLISTGKDFTSRSLACYHEGNEAD